MKQIAISIGIVSFTAELESTLTAQRIWDALPLEGAGNLWGDEIYFEIPVVAPEEPDAHCDVEIGTIAYWPPGKAFCIFFGRTPVSTTDQPRAFSRVNVIGRATGDVRALRTVTNGVQVRVERVPDTKIV
jgi:uncharacterized protein